MKEPETIYSADYQPDPTSSLDVLAFLLVPERAFLSERDCTRTRREVKTLLHDAKRDALLKWYRHHTRQR